MVALLKDRRGVASQLRSGLYAQPALVPATPWLASAQKPVVQMEVLLQEGRPVMQTRAADSVARVLVWWRRSGRWQWRVAAPGLVQALPADVDAVAVAGLDAAGNEGPRRQAMKAPGGAWTQPQGS
jgi:hypothetical protein